MIHQEFSEKNFEILTKIDEIELSRSLSIRLCLEIIV